MTFSIAGLDLCLSCLFWIVRGDVISWILEIVDSLRKEMTPELVVHSILKRLSLDLLYIVRILSLGKNGRFQLMTAEKHMNILTLSFK